MKHEDGKTFSDALPGAALDQRSPAGEDTADMAPHPMPEPSPAGVPSTPGGINRSTPWAKGPDGPAAAPAEASCAGDLFFNTTNPLLKHAIAYAKMDWPVIPVDPKTKRPLGGLGIDHATTNPSRIKKWWTRWPHAAIGVRLDAAGLCAIDIDPRNGATATPADYPKTLTARTGGGGSHLIYRAPAGVKLPGTLGPGIDLKHHGYIIVAPSKHPSGGSYSWESDFDVVFAYLIGEPDIADFPMEVLGERPAPAAKKSPVTPDADGGIPVGERNARLSDEAYRLRKKGLTVAAIEKVLLALNAAACTPPLSDGEVRAIARGKRGVKSEMEELVDDFKDLGKEEEPADEPGSVAEAIERIAFKPIDDIDTWGDLDWIIKSVLPVSETYAVLYGDSNTGKSFLALDIGMAIARGIAWRGYKVRQGRVGYIAAEAAGGMKNRIKAYLRENDLKASEVPFFLMKAAPNFTNKEQMAKVVISAKKLRLNAIVVDTKAAVTPGDDENSSEAVTKFISYCQALAHATGCTIILIHHSGKDVTRGARGSSALRASADTELEVSELEPGLSVLRITKMREGEKGLVFPFRLTKVCLGQDADGDPITSCVVEHTDDVPAKTRIPNGKHSRVALQVICDKVDLEGKVSFTVALDEFERRMPPIEVGERTNKWREAGRTAIQALVNQGFIRLEDGIITVLGAK